MQQAEGAQRSKRVRHRAVAGVVEAAQVREQRCRLTSMHVSDPSSTCPALNPVSVLNWKLSMVVFLRCA